MFQKSLKFFISEIRLFQIFVMFSLLGVGVYLYEFNLEFSQVVLTFCGGVLTQLFFIKKLGLKTTSVLSALITCAGLTLLLRSNNLWLHPLAASLAIGSKFFIRHQGKHFLNPTMTGLVISLVLFKDSWLSPGQWGAYTIFAFWLIVIGSLLTRRAKQFDMAWVFLLFYVGGIGVRNLYLGYELPITFHAAQNGALLLFAFFMITDPRTAPNHIRGKVIFAFFVALLALVYRFHYFNNHGLIYSLFIVSFTVPFLNKIFISKPFQWSQNENHNFSHA